MKNYFTILIILVLVGCQTKTTEQQIENWKQEVVSTEKAFAEMAKDKGIEAAFVAFADSNAVINRENSVLKGVSAVKEFYHSRDLSNVELSWAPDFVDVSSSGDLAYTYGKYIYAVTDSLGNKTESTGIFHTVWKRQSDGSWKFVWD